MKKAIILCVLMGSTLRGISSDEVAEFFAPAPEQPRTKYREFIVQIPKTDQARPARFRPEDTILLAALGWIAAHNVLYGVECLIFNDCK